MATVELVITGQDKTAQMTKSVSSGLDSIVGSADRLSRGLSTLAMGFSAWYAGSKIWEGFKYGISVVDEFQQRAITMSAMITSLQGGADVAGNYLKAKEYAAGLNEVLMQVDARTTLNLQNLQVISEEMIKQGVVLDYNNAAQVEGFTRMANAAAVYSRNGADERQLRQEVGALLRGQVDESSQLASIVQRTVQGPLSQQVDKWKQSGTLIEKMGEQLNGFGPASDDLNKTWSAVKSSLETSLNLIARAGFTGIVKEMVEWLDKLNGYLKTHREEVGEKIRAAWEDVKTAASLVAPVIKELYEHAALFVGLFVGGALIKGLTTAYGLYKDIRAVVRDIALLQAGSAIAGAVGAGGAAVVTGEAIAGGAAASGAAGLLAKVRAVPGMQYLLNPATAGLAAAAWISAAKDANDFDDVSKINKYNNFSAMKYKFMMDEGAGMTSENAIETISGKAPIPKIITQDTQEQIKHKTEQFDKELATYKTFKDREAAIAKAAADVEVAIMKGRFDQGLESTGKFYDEEKRIAVAAAEAELTAAKGYLDRINEHRKSLQDKTILEYLEKSKGSDSPEYQTELKKREEAITSVEKAELHLQKTSIDAENKITDATRKRNEEYVKMQATVLDSAQKYSEAEAIRQASDRKSTEYLRLKKEAEETTPGAAEALAARELDYENKKLDAKLKVVAAQRAVTDALFEEQQQISKLNSVDQQLLETEKNLYSGRNSLLNLQDQLTKATLNGATQEINLLESKIRLQETNNRQLATDVELQQQIGILNGSIAGFSNGQAIATNGGGAFNNGVAVPLYQSAADILKQQAKNSDGTGKTNYWGEPIDAKGNTINPFNLPSSGSSFMGPLSTGTNYVPADGYAFIHKGEAVVPEQYNPAAGAANVAGNTTIELHGGINVTIQSTGQETYDADKLARLVFPKLQEFGRRRFRDSAFG